MLYQQWTGGRNKKIKSINALVPLVPNKKPSIPTAIKKKLRGIE